MTLFDLECFLKRGDYQLKLIYRNGKYVAEISQRPDYVGAVNGQSNTLAQAIDNALLELRTAPGKRPDTQGPSLLNKTPAAVPGVYGGGIIPPAFKMTFCMTCGKSWVTGTVSMCSCQKSKSSP